MNPTPALDRSFSGAPLAPLRAELRDHDMDALWERLEAPPGAPAPSAVPFLWRYREVAPLVAQAGESVSLADAERRVLMLVNPALKERGATSATLQANFQLVLPGETARAHRHTMSAIRFVVSGSGAFTVVDGEQVLMRPGDLVLTPNWSWHDHANDGPEPVLWLDGLDRPLVSMLELEVFERFHQSRQDVVAPVATAPVVRYPWEQTESALRAAAAAGVVTPADDVVMDYTDPRSGGPVTATIGCHAQWLRPGVRTSAHRQTSTTIYHVVRGSGATRIDGAEFAWEEHDTFVVPSWSVHAHENASMTGEAVLFAYSDEPALRALGLYREQAVSD